MRSSKKRHLLQSGRVTVEPELVALAHSIVDLSDAEADVAEVVASTFRDLRLKSLTAAAAALGTDVDGEDLLECNAECWETLAEQVAETICFDSTLINLADAVEMAVAEVYATDLRELIRDDVAALKDSTTSWKEL